MSGPKPIWECKVGMLGNAIMPDGCDFPMREAVRSAYARIVGAEPQFCFSGWSASLTEGELAVVEDRLPDPTRISARVRIVVELDERISMLRFIKRQELTPEARTRYIGALAALEGIREFAESV